MTICDHIPKHEDDLNEYFRLFFYGTKFCIKREEQFHMNNLKVGETEKQREGF